MLVNFNTPMRMQASRPLRTVPKPSRGGATCAPPVCKPRPLVPLHSWSSNSCCSTPRATKIQPVAADAVRDYDGRYGRAGQDAKVAAEAATAQAVPQSSPTPPTPSLEELLADLSPEEQRTVAVFQENSPSVCNVSTTTTSFGLFPFSMVQVPRGSGSGFIWDTKGHVITNSHVVANATGVTITLYGGAVAKASVVGRDREKDVAVLKLDLPADQLAKLVPVKLGCSSNLLVGQKVYALGNPFGLDLSLTQGIVSGLGREIGSPSPMGLPITNVIQTDAAINPGNSGGPLLDSKGRLVGINTAIADPTGQGVFSGVGFAIPIDNVKGMVDQILVHGRVIRPALGLTIAPLPASMSSLPAGSEGGVLVVQVRPGGPADEAGILPTRREALFGRVLLGDVITGIDGKPIKKQRDLYAVLDTCKVGQTIEVTLAPRRLEAAPPSPYSCSPHFGSNGHQRTPAAGGAVRERTVRVVLADRRKLQWGSE